MSVLVDTCVVYRIKSYNSSFYCVFFECDSAPGSFINIKQSDLMLNSIPYTTILSPIWASGDLTDNNYMDVSPSDGNIISYSARSDNPRYFTLKFLLPDGIVTPYTSGVQIPGNYNKNPLVMPAVVYFLHYGTDYYIAFQGVSVGDAKIPDDGLHYYTIDSLPHKTNLGNVTIIEESGNNGFSMYYATHNTSSDKIAEYILKNYKPYNENNPYDNVGDEPGDPGQGDFDYSSDDVPIPDLPKTNVTDSGLVSLFAPDEGQLRQLAKFLWSDNFSLDSFKKIFNNPMDCILGLSILPIHLPHGGAKEITVGNIVSTVSCDTCSEQYVKLNCGSFTFSRSRFTGGYLDNAPYTRCYLYLPFIGTQEINIDEFMGATLGVEYHIDILTGAMFCFVTRNSKLLLTYSGNCAENVPLSANDFTSTISSMLSMATVGAGAIATIATAGAAAPTTAGMASEALGARTASSLIGAGAQGASAVMDSKPNVSHSGSLGGGAGAMGQLYPYLIFIAPRPDIPADQNSYTGFPSNKIEKIGNLKGFNVIEAVNLKVEGANDTEMSEIEAILKGGVII